VVTEPSWSTSHIDSSLRLIDALAAHGEKSDDTLEVGDEVDQPVGLRVSSVRSATTAPTDVAGDAPIQAAITIMASHHYSQLPVNDGGRVIGVITWESIGLNAHRLPNCVRDAMSAEPAPLVSPEAELLSIVDVVAQHGFVLVYDRGEVIGIVTLSDLAEDLGALAHPFFIIGDIERQLRKLAKLSVDFGSCGVVPRFPPRDASGNKREAEGYEDLGFNELAEVFQRNWPAFPWNLDQVLFKERLDEVRHVRNEVMHFRPDPPSPATMSDLANIARWLRQLG